ncbi:hypothetical protein SERLA73DRAFT_161924 [Serpula lacrymans var. lacrymans S7.3]|uniref:Uncharacterized protein n=2 Tax=Serpula lacrymans var. lacrymans TaxID=341189 RepID=F8Q4G8_SERL3|nr:hypothetical protein SERLA73DRAFT_161924 [Serpula lacrymans var. lacrymans S7.3]
MKSKVSSDAIAKRKRAKYAATRPAPLANELALMQFADGGNMDSHIKRVMDAQAKAVAGPGRVAGVGDVYRDGEGGVWWDQAEEWEYAHLLGGSDPKTQGTGDMDWVTFDNGAKSPKNAHTLIAPCTAGEGEERRGSVSTQDSDLDPQYIVQPTDHFDTDDLAVFGSALVPLVSRKPAMSVLALPARSRRTAKHLRKPEYMVDAAFPRIPGSPKGARFPASATGAVAKPKPKGKARRRPAPLTLSPPSPAFKQPSSSPLDAEKVRKDFIESSFEPAVPATPATPSTAAIAQATVDTRGKLTSRALNLPFRNVNSSTASLPAKKSLGVKPSRLNMNVMGLFRSNRKEGVVH